MNSTVIRKGYLLVNAIDTHCLLHYTSHKSRHVLTIDVVFRRTKILQQDLMKIEKSSLLVLILSLQSWELFQFHLRRLHYP